MKIYCSSDWHLGSSSSDIPKILEFLDLVLKDADQLIILGDCFDLWESKFEDIISTEPSKSAYEKLIQVSEKIQVTLIWGNHDYNVSKHLRGTKIQVVDEYTRDTIHYCHGWRQDAQQVFAYPYWGFIVELFPSIYQRFFKTPSKIIDDPIPYQDLCSEYHNVCRKTIEKEGYSFLLVGHSHWPTHDGKLIDVGDFCQHSSFAVIENGIPELKQL